MTKTEPSEYTHRYTTYAAQHGKTPDEMLAHDRERFPGGKMTGFMLWISDRWSAWHKERGFVRHEHIITRADHADFDAWITDNPKEV